MIFLMIFLAIAGEEDFYRAAALERDGKPAEAAAIYRGITEGPFADDALAELGRLLEEQLGDPLAAAETYERLVHDFPDSRLATRARRRAEALRVAMGPGARDAPAVAAMNGILLGSAGRPRAESIARMEALLQRSPDFPDAGRALYWLGTALADEGRRADGRRRLAEARRRFPGTEWAARAARAEGELLLEDGDRDGAEAIFLALRAADPEAAAGGLEHVRTARRRALAVVIAWLLVAAALAGALLAIRRAAGSLRPLLRPPVEALYFIPVAALFIAAAATENVAMTHAVAWVCAGGLLAAWLSGAALDAARAAGLPVGARRVLAHAAVAIVALAAVCVIAVVRAGLVDFLLETLRFGPER